MNTQISRRIADASAIAVLIAMATTWVVPKGLGMLVSSGWSGYDLIGQGSITGQDRQFVILTPLAALVCLGILILSETNPTSYEQQRKTYAVVRLICAGIGAVPIFMIMVAVQGFASQGSLGSMLIPLEIGQGVWLTLIALLVIVVEAWIDYQRP